MQSSTLYILLVLSVLLSCSTTKKADAETKPRGKDIQCNVTVDTKTKLSKISDLFWGTNFLYWIEDDNSLADGRIEKLLTDLPCTILRYPGGTVADNYHWKTNMLDNAFMFPYEQGDEQSDFEEFMVFCKKVGAEPMLVVNTQSWFLKDDIEGGAKEAADWVKHCLQKGYKIKYWEIGNETYWHPVMTAKEYGALVSVYAKAMKSVDPSIIVSANGHWDVNMVGTKERVDPILWDKIRQMYLDINSEKQYKDLTTYIEQVTIKPVTKGKTKWWENVINECGDHIDMVSVHWYFFNNTLKHTDSKINELQAMLKAKRPDKDYLFCLSEYNCNTEGLEERVAGLAEGIGRFLNTGVDISCFWPLRIGGSNNPKHNRNMMSLAGSNKQYPYDIFKLFSANLRGDMVKCTSTDKLFTFASTSEQQTTVVVSAEGIDVETAVIIDPGFDVANSLLTLNSFAATKDQSMIGLEESEVKWKIEQGKIIFDIAPNSFVMATIKPNKK